MAIVVKIPAPLRKLTAGSGEVEAQGETVAQVLDDLEQRYPGLKERLCEGDGELRRFINIYVDGEDIRFLNGLATPIQSGEPGSEIVIVPAMAGG